MIGNELPKIVTGTVPGPIVKDVMDRRMAAMPGAIKSVYPVAIKRGKGAMFEDLDGNLFLDWVGGVGVLNIGYSHPEIIEAVKNQADNYFHAMMNIVTHEPYIELAEKLNEIVPVRGDKKKSFFANSGSEAVENAVKIAKSYTGRTDIIVFTGAFHGRTSLAMAMTSKKAYAVGMGPFPAGVYRAPYPNMYRKPLGYSDEAAIDFYIKELENLFETGSPANNIAAIVLEPIQGEGGFVPAPIEWVKRVREICDENGIMLIADEVQCGFCRSGKMFASEYWKEAGCEPDIIATAKSIAAGMPLSAIVASAEIIDNVTVGTIGGTYCGNAMACVSALKTIEIMERERLDVRAMEIAEKCRTRFESWKKFGIIGDIRGVGSMMGVEFVKDLETKEPYSQLVAAVVQEAIQNGLIIESAGTFGNVVRMLSPLVITDEQLEAGLDIYEKAIEKVLNEMK